ncbi:MAG: AI-2E family transporter [Gammaproteobacteria bacterium]|nr:AI-2E family transporter [Gammaproteobacteria bacterium]
MTTHPALSKSIPFAAGCIIVYFIGSLLITGRSILIPIVLALLIWHFLNAMHRAIRQLPKIGSRLPYWLSFLLTGIIVSLLAIALFSIISNNVSDVTEAAPRYQARVQSLLNQIDTFTHIKSRINVSSLFDDWNLQSLFIGVYSVFASLTSSSILIGLYVIFLFVEQHFFTNKLAALFADKKHLDLTENILKHLTQDTQLYLGLKTFLGLITAVASWLIMTSVGLDFSEFWALLIFFLTFIPNIGAIIAVGFPALIALVQFQTVLPCLIITSGIILIQFIIGSLIEPRYLSKSLNLSPLIILIALAFWGTVWGVIGMFLAVPITVMMMIIFAHFESTRPFAILLSQDGCIQKSYEKI